MKKSKVIVIIVAALTLLTWGTSTFLEYREKNATSLIPFEEERFVSLFFTDDLSTTDPTDSTSHHIDAPEAIHELLDFLHEYDVKKEWWQGSNYTDDEIIGYFTITHETMRPITIVLYEDYMRTGTGKRRGYTVVNGPIDVEWLKAWEEEHYN